jgi:hypothetical protein
MLVKLACVAAYLVAVGGMFYFLLTYEEPSHGRDLISSVVQRFFDRKADEALR